MEREEVKANEGLGGVFSAAAATTKKVFFGKERPDLPLPTWRMNPYSDS